MRMWPPPWAWMLPPGWQAEQQQQQAPDIIVPMRVNKALEFVALMNQKTMTRAAVSESQIQQIDGQQLTSEEGACLATAANLLSHYFAGKLTPDVWEALRVDALRHEVERAGLMGKLMPCIVCCTPGPVQPNCFLCNGTGKILVASVGNKVQPQDDEDDVVEEELVDDGPLDGPASLDDSSPGEPGQ